jgi:hypothetical protein
MGTTHNFDTPAAGTMSLTDTIPTINATTSRGATATLSQVNTLFLTSGQSVVNTTATGLTVTAALHAGRTVTLSSAVPIAVVLPQATGTGNVYRFAVLVAATGTSSTISVANATDVMTGIQITPVTGTAANMAKATSATSDRISLNGTTTGGAAGSVYELIDVKTGVFTVFGYDTSVSATTSPFSAAV